MSRQFVSMTINVAEQQSVFNERLDPGVECLLKRGLYGTGFLILCKDDTNGVLAVDE